MELKQHNAANGVRTRVLPSGRFLVLKIRDAQLVNRRKERKVIVEIMDGKELVLPDACETQKDRLEVYSWLMWKAVERIKRNDGYKRIHRDA